MTHFQIININNSHTWDDIVKSFPNYDVYYLSGYAKSFQIHGDGLPILLYYEKKELRAIYVAFKRDIAKSNLFIDKIESNTLFDIISPYGYGGFLIDGNISKDSLLSFKNEYLLFLQQENIISNFVRYHPSLKNAEFIRKVFNIIDIGKTISMELNSKELIWSNISSKNKNMIRKAQKNGIKIMHGKGTKLLNKFIEIYNITMNNDHAEQYYYFDYNFYHSLDLYLNNNYEIFYAKYEEKIIAMSIIIFANTQMHYHLSGSLKEYRNLAPSNLLLYEAACWGHEQGFISFHLGGGLGSTEDNLFKFKQAFNRYSQNQFSIGKEIINKDLYNKLVILRKENSTDFDINSSFFPLYRA